MGQASVHQQTKGYWVSDWAVLRPNQIAFVDGVQRYTWSELHHYSTQVARHLKNQGVASGDTLAVMGKNHAHALWLFLAAQQLDLQISFMAPGPESVIAKKWLALSKADSTLWLYDRNNNRPNLQPSNQLSFAETSMAPELLPLQRLRLPIVDNESAITQIANHPTSAVATLTFTSGSMGHPKIVAHSHQQHFASATGLLSAFSFTQHDCWLLSLPLYHVSGLAIIYRWLRAGACLKIGSGDLVNDILGVTHASLVPVQLARLLAAGVNSMRLSHVLLGGSHIPNALCAQAEQCGIEVWLGYGMTEAASTVTAKRANQTNGVGTVLPLRRVKVEQQRIYVGGDTLALGYYEQGRLLPLTDDHAWFDTQDLGDWREGELLVLGRADNMFISGGENVHCEEIEAALIRHPDIEFALVLPVVDPEYGARPIAVIRSLNGSWSQAEFEHCLAQSLDKYKWPIAYYSLPESLLNQGIKLSRRDVKAWFGTLATNYLVMS
jgi:O-succinylbenzoic acid--CoA ligase